MNTPVPFIAAADFADSVAWVNALQNAMPEEKIVLFSSMNDTNKEKCSVAVVANPNPADIQQLPQLRWLQSVWAGVDHLLSDMVRHDLKIVRLIDPDMAKVMAEAVLAWTMYLHRDMPAYKLQQEQQYWRPRNYIRPQHKTIGLLGLGKLGESAAQSLLSANFKVCGWSRNRKEIVNVECFAGYGELQTMLAKSNILICLLPLTRETTGLIDAKKLACLPDGASIINFSRGAILCEEALLAALDSGRLEHAVLDVFSEEPLPIGKWQWRHPRLTMLPHCSAPTDRTTASAIIAENIRRYRKYGAIPKSVDRTCGY